MLNISANHRISRAHVLLFVEMKPSYLFSIEIFMYCLCLYYVKCFTGLLNKIKCFVIKSRSVLTSYMLTVSTWEHFKNPLHFSLMQTSCSFLTLCSFVLELATDMYQLHFSLAELTLWQARIHSVLILSPSPIGFDWPQHMLSSPTAQPINHCLLIQYKRKFAQGARLNHYQCLVSVYFGTRLLQSLDVWHERIYSIRQWLNLWCSALMVWILIKLVWFCVCCSFFWHFIHNCLLSARCVHAITHITPSLIVHRDLLSHNFERKVTLHNLSSGRLVGSFIADACSPGYMCPLQTAIH